MTDEKDTKPNQSLSTVSTVLEGEAEKVSSFLASEQVALDQHGVVFLSGVAFAHRQTVLMHKQLSLMVLARIKDEKLYKGMAYPRPDGEDLIINSWAEYTLNVHGVECSVLDKKLRLRKRLGEDVFTSLTKIGVTQSLQHELSRIPELERLPVIEAITECGDDRNQVQVVINAWAEKQEIEKSKLESDLKKAKEDNEISERQIEDKNKKIDEYDKEIKHLENLPINKVLEKARRTLTLKRERALTAVWEMRAAALKVKAADRVAQNGMLPQNDINEAVYRVYQELEQTVIDLGLPPGHFKLQYLEEEGTQGVLTEIPVNKAEQSADDLGGEASNITPFPSSPTSPENK